MALFTAIGTAVGSIFSGGFFASTFGKFVVKTLARAATSFLVNALMGGRSSGYSGMQGTLQTGEQVPRGAPIGKCATEGSLVYANTWGKAGKTPNAYLTQVIALSDLPTKGLLRVQVNGAWVTLLSPADPDKGSPVQEFRVGSTDYLWVKFYDGTQTAADPFVVSTVASAERPYPSTRVGVGVAYAICTSRLNPKLFTSFPRFRFELDSVKLYDPSKDTTVGGSGTQRWNDRATWGGDGDYLPVVQAYNIMRGITYAGRWVYGFQGMSAGRLPSAEWIAQINLCRATVPISATESEPAYRSGAFLQFNTECGTVLEAIMTAAAGRIADIGGVYKPQVGSSIGSPVVSITDGNIASEQDAPCYPVVGLAQLVNAVTAQFPNPDDGYNMKDAPALYRSDLEAIDRGRRLPAHITFNNVPYSFQAQRLMRTAIDEARRFRRHTLPMDSDFWMLEPGDVIEWTSARHGYVAKKFRVTAALEEPTSAMIIDLTEVDPADYTAPAYGAYLPITSRAAVTVIPPAEVLDGWSVSPITIQDGLGNDRRPAASMEWSTADLDDCPGISIEIRLYGGDVVARHTVMDFASGQYIWMGGLPGVAYEARAQVMASRPTAWTAWDAFTLDPIQFGQIDLDGSKEEAALLGPVDIPPTGHVFLTLAMGPSEPNQIWKRGLAFWGKCRTDYGATIALERRFKNSGVWGAWGVWGTWDMTTTWEQYTSSGTLAGVYEDVEMRLVVDASFVTHTAMLRDLYLTFGNIVK